MMEQHPKSNRKLPVLTVIDGGRREIELALVRDIFLNRFDPDKAERPLGSCLVS